MSAGDVQAARDGIANRWQALRQKTYAMEAIKELALRQARSQRKGA